MLPSRRLLVELLCRALPALTAVLAPGSSRAAAEKTSCSDPGHCAGASLLFYRADFSQVPRIIVIMRLRRRRMKRAKWPWRWLAVQAVFNEKRDTVSELIEGLWSPGFTGGYAYLESFTSHPSSMTFMEAVLHSHRWMAAKCKTESITEIMPKFCHWHYWTKMLRDV